MFSKEEEKLDSNKSQSIEKIIKDETMLLFIGLLLYDNTLI